MVRRRTKLPIHFNMSTQVKIQLKKGVCTLLLNSKSKFMQIPCNFSICLSV